MQDERDRARARQAQCKPESSPAFGGGAVCHIRRTAVGVAHGRHGSREIIYTFTRHACNNAATAMPGPWTQRQVRDSEKSCLHATSQHIGSWLTHAPSCLRRGGLHPRCPQAQAHPTCALRVAQSSAAAAPVRAAYRSDTRCDLYVISTCQSRRRLMAHS